MKDIKIKAKKAYWITKTQLALLKCYISSQIIDKDKILRIINQIENYPIDGDVEEINYEKYETDDIIEYEKCKAGDVDV